MDLWNYKAEGCLVSAVKRIEIVLGEEGLDCVNVSAVNCDYRIIMAISHR